MVTRIVWLALAEARGHLMRAQLMRRLLAREGIRVDIVTTRREGVDFLAAFDTPARVLSLDFGLAYDERQRLARGATARRLAWYLLSPRRCLRDLRRLEALADGAALVVNDSFHPALLLAPAWRSPLRVVHVHGETMRQAVEGHFAAGVYRRAIARLLARGFARVEHTLDAERADPDARTWRLLPVVDQPAPFARAPGKLAVVYLNPHFRDARTAAAIEAALAAHGYGHVHAVGEGYAAAGRAGWRAHDDALAGAIAAADVVVSAAGMGVLAQCRLHRTPLVALACDQPEQRLNLRHVERDGGAVVAVGDRLRDELSAALRRLSTTTTARSPDANVVRELQGR